MPKLTQEDRDKIINTGKPPANFMDAVDKLMKGDATDLAEIMSVVDEGYEKAIARYQTIQMRDGTVMVPKRSPKLFKLPGGSR